MFKIIFLVNFFTLTSFCIEIVINQTQQSEKNILLNVSQGSDMKRDDDRELVYDLQRALMWQDDESVLSIQKDLSGAKAYCKNLYFAGYSDWHLPSRKELATLVDRTSYKPAINDEFENVVSDGYWSSTNAFDESETWYIDFASGKSEYNGDSSAYYIRCIRLKGSF